VLPAEARGGATVTRAAWFVRTGAVPALWLLLAAASGVRALTVGIDAWLPVHLLLLGAVSNAILIWSAYFTNAFLRTSDDGRPGQARRLAAFNVGAVGVVEGVVHDAPAMVAAGAALIVAVVVWHVVWLVGRLRASLPARFSGTVRYYVAASLLLAVGVGLGVARQREVGDEALGDRIVVAHLTLNVVGWIGLTVLGTLVTLWPTMLRTQMPADAERPPIRALPVLVIALLVSVAGVLVDLRVVAALGLVLFVGALVPASKPLLDETRGKPPYDFATRAVAAAAVWFVAALAALAIAEIVSADWEIALGHIESRVLPMLVLGFALQTVLGALTYLAPVVLGGGPSAARRNIARVELWGSVRVAAFNVALVVGVAAGGVVRGCALAVCGACALGAVTLVASTALGGRHGAP
jgi:nitrite reductase (NO-forming)